MASKVKCYSVRLESLISVSEKCYKATSFDGSTALIPKSQVFGQDSDVQKSEAFWISEWILKQKELQYSEKKASFFDKERADFIPETGVKIDRHIPEVKDPVEVEVVAELVKEERNPLTIDFVKNNIGEVIEWFCYGYHANLPYSGKCKILGILDSSDQREPRIEVEHISGDRLEYGWFEFGKLNYTDSGRVVYIGKEFEIINIKWEVPNHGYLFENNNPMNCSVVKHLNSQSTVEQLIKSNTTADVVMVDENKYIKGSDGNYFKA